MRMFRNHLLPLPVLESSSEILALPRALLDDSRYWLPLALHVPSTNIPDCCVEAWKTPRGSIPRHDRGGLTLSALRTLG